MLLFNATLMIYKNKRINWPSDWRILRPYETKQRNPASVKKHSKNLNDCVRLEDFDFCKDKRKNCFFMRCFLRIKYDIHGLCIRSL